MEQRNSIQFLIVTFLISFILLSVTFGVSTGVKAFRGKADLTYFESDTYIGPVKIDGLTKKQAMLVLNQETENWSARKPSIQLLFDEVKPDHALVDFDVATSVSQATSGKRNKLFAAINKESFDQVQAQLSLNGTEMIDIERLKGTLLDYAVHLSATPKTINLSNYLITESEENHVFAFISLNSLDHDASFENWVRKHHEIVVKENSVFSFNEIVKNEPDGLYTEEFKNVLSSALYKAALNSPFSIVERSISTDNRFKQETGYEAFVDLQHDLKIKNVYGQPLTFIFNMNEGKLTVTVVGPKSPITITSSIQEKVELKPRIIVYPVEKSSDEYEVEGKNGVQVTVVRAVTIANTSWKTYKQSVDSYLPTPEQWYRVFEDNETEQESEDK